MNTGFDELAFASSEADKPVIFVCDIAALVEISALTIAPTPNLPAVIAPVAIFPSVTVKSVIAVPLIVPDANDVVPDTIKLPTTALPPINAFPLIPAPPDTTSAPVDVLVDTVELLISDATLVCLKFGLVNNDLPDTLNMVAVVVNTLLPLISLAEEII